MRPQLLLPRVVGVSALHMVFPQAGEPFRCPLSHHTKIIHLVLISILEFQARHARATACHAGIAPSALSVHSPLARVPFLDSP